MVTNSGPPNPPPKIRMVAFLDEEKVTLTSKRPAAPLRARTMRRVRGPHILARPGPATCPYLRLDGALRENDYTAREALPTMKSYTFKVVVEPDEDRWHAFCPALEREGCATWGHTREEALKNIDEVIQLVVESMIEHGEQLPQ